ncbi:hypothetical protein Mkiyose1665_48060 [Mycobacterium kiyosense]|uniref:Uncharacterized protein n=1 Tax=Mycobacterium kiyosense TaxID=2871094 RepID=A0A9P3UW67_9MYCO|nr:hypothetical protein IWGMT90018_06410 [Mycobacterium kiyosense]BDE12025.1 hypothetical protein MKCMC460_08850 [Mycobacterium sp. 20KCMC460]GLB84266.1 hypothetical protein SRL2020028_35220 [Mycobacterium kiyosense]GLB91686.1 hypothetical protein SRL2020130_45030 [Mycobacterium kiyosense]GLB97673.1 hypothetical protein SRL2020226_44490 [Mycobacterium kiyosense]
MVANSLLDFVIALVRDPDAAARYAANPAQAIADAHLTNVTSTDVNNLIPVVSDSLSMAGPVGGGTGDHVGEHGNVWASGAATAALDAFTPHNPAVAGYEHAPLSGVSGVINHPAPVLPHESPVHSQPAAIAHHEASSLITGIEGAQPGLDHGGLPLSDPSIWDHAIIHPDAHQHDPQPDHHGFGIHG